MVIPAYSLSLSRVRWNLFASITFKKECSEAAAIIKGMQWVNYVSQLTREPLWRMLWVMRVERGELGGRVHLHLLHVVPEPKMGLFVVSSGFSSVARKFCMKRFGMSRFRRIESEGDGAVTYATKDLDAGADSYELAKTGRAQFLITSGEAQRVMRGEVRAHATNGKLVNTLVDSTE